MYDTLYKIGSFVMHYYIPILFAIVMINITQSLISIMTICHYQQYDVLGCIIFLINILPLYINGVIIIKTQWLNKLRVNYINYILFLWLIYTYYSSSYTIRNNMYINTLPYYYIVHFTIVCELLKFLSPIYVKCMTWYIASRITNTSMTHGVPNNINMNLSQ